MRAIVNALRQGIKNRPQTLTAILIFFACCAVYLLNGIAISSNDNVPNALLALNWLDNGSLNFDIFQTEAYYKMVGSTDLPYYLIEAPNGHVTSTYPIGVAIITFPVYALLFAGLRVSEFFHSLAAGSPVDLLDLTNRELMGNVFSFEKIAATVVAAVSVVIFFLIVRLKFSPLVCVFAVFAYAFATTTWQTSSQGLWQHASSNLVVLSIILCLLKANRAEGNDRRILLLVAGIFCGLLPGIRPTSIIYSLAAIVYALVAYRREALFLLLGLPSLLISASWNFYYFGFSLRNFIYGGYTRFSEDQDFTQKWFSLTLAQFQEGFTGLLFSPSRGLLTFTPLMLFAAPGGYQVWKRRLDRDEQLLLGMTLAALVLFIQYCFFKVWGAGWSYGPRYMTDLLPVLSLLVAYFLANFFPQIDRINRLVFRGIFSLFLTLLLYSTFVQLVGVFGLTHWNGIPYWNRPDIYWQWQDSQIERHTRKLWFDLTQPLGDPTTYLQKFGGEVLAIDQVDRQPPSTPLVVNLSASQSAGTTFTMQVRNIGQNQWFGYETGASGGVAVVRVQVFPVGDRTQPAMPPAYLYVSGNPRPGETAEAIGAMVFTVEPGEYDLVMDMGVAQVGMPPTPEQHPVFTQRITLQ